MESYKAQIGSYPTNISTLTSGPTATTINGVSETVGPWLKELPGTSNYTISVDALGSGTIQVNGAAYEGATNPCNSLKA